MKLITVILLLSIKVVIMKKLLHFVHEGTWDWWDLSKGKTQYKIEQNNIVDNSKVNISDINKNQTMVKKIANFFGNASQQVASRAQYLWKQTKNIISKNDHNNTQSNPQIWKTISYNISSTTPNNTQTTQILPTKTLQIFNTASQQTNNRNQQIAAWKQQVQKYKQYY